MPGHFTFYTSHIDHDLATFGQEETRHAIQALRYKAGDEIEFTDGKGHTYTGVIEKTGKQEFTARITAVLQAKELPGLRLAIGLVKHADRLEWLTEKCTEMGVRELIFLQTANTEKSRLNMERLQRIAVSALKQSHGSRLPEISLKSLDDILHTDATHKLICHCRPETGGEHAGPDALQDDCLVLVGPEGDFTAAEVAEAHRQGFKNLSLGAMVLRTESAGIALAGAYLIRQANRII